MDFVIFVLSMALLVGGADIVIRASHSLALKLNISEFIIGASLIALGTSLPQIATVSASVMDNRGDMAISIIIGSNIFNLTLLFATILLLSKKINISKEFFIKNSFWLIASLSLFILVLLDKTISTLDYSILIIFMIAYIRFLFHDAKDIDKEFIKDISKTKLTFSKSIFLSIIGVLSTIFGAFFIVDSAINIANIFKLNDWEIGIIMISLGISLPQLLLTILAIYKSKVEIAIGNIISSNIANSTIVLGISAILHPIKIDLTHHIFDISTMIISTIFVTIILITKSYTRAISIVMFLILALFIDNLIRNI
ncbi:Inner membrane protein YrbG, predicted calcium/sodium:proton antiporter [hydrothermal vent metagenome]|uniref:Inner membrane protein YrbG, predicted calcium/sodium:proton antiporter n=1 Tax=hydrothermal vent metagenome TaxID=652676 RepID=A0A1W1EJI0_9ZZZZ